MSFWAHLVHLSRTETHLTHSVSNKFKNATRLNTGIQTEKDKPEEAILPLTFVPQANQATNSVANKRGN